MVFFDPEPIRHTRPELTYLPIRPDGGTRTFYNNFFAFTYDAEEVFSETVNTTEHEIIETDEFYWKHSTYLQNSRAGESRGGTGEADYAMTGADMISYLEEIMANPDDFILTYTESLEFISLQSEEVLHDIWWRGTMQLTSLRVIDVAEVPEPPLMALVGTGLVGIALARRRQRQRQVNAC